MNTKRQTIRKVRGQPELSVFCSLLYKAPDRPSSSRPYGICSTKAPVTTSPVPAYFPDGSRNNYLYNVSSVGTLTIVFTNNI